MQKDSWDKGIVLTGLLVVIGGITFVAVWYQARETARAAVAARDSAKSYIASERAWLIPTSEAIEPIGLPTVVLADSQVETFTVRIENCGRTPAWLMDWFVYVEVLDDTNIGEFTNAGQPEGDFPNARPFPQNRTEEFHVEWTTNQFEIAAIKAGRKHLYIHGFLQYRSIAGDEPRVSRFCFHYFHKRNAAGRMEEGWVAEPTEENHYT